MYIGDILWETVYLAIIVFGALGLFRLRGTHEKTSLRLWVRFSVLLFGLSVIALVEGSLLSAYGLGWFALALALTVCLVAKLTPKMLKQGPY